MTIDTDFENRLTTLLHDRAETAMNDAEMSVPLVASAIQRRSRRLSFTIVSMAAVTLVGLVVITARATDTGPATSGPGSDVAAPSVGTTDEGVPVRRSMTPSATEGQTVAVTFDVPAGSTLQLTEFTLQNPAGDSGLAVLLNNTTPLYQVSLDDVAGEKRVSWVSPIEVSGGTSLAFEITCDASTNSSRTCTTSILLSGRLVPAR